MDKYTLQLGMEACISSHSTNYSFIFRVTPTLYEDQEELCRNCRMWIL